MRHILTSVVLVVLLFPSLASGETVKWGDLIVREGLHYKKFTDVPFTGKVVDYYENGQLFSKGTYKDGVKVK